MRTQSDPVADPDAYRTLLLAALGATIRPTSSARRSRRSAVRGRGGGPHRRPAGRTVAGPPWNASGTSRTASSCSRDASAGSSPTTSREIIGYDQDAWVARLRHGVDDPHALVGLFTALRRSNLALWAASSPAERRADRSPQRARPGELRPDVPPGRRPRPDPSRAGAGGPDRGPCRAARRRGRLSGNLEQRAPADPGLPRRSPERSPLRRHGHRRIDRRAMRCRPSARHMECAGPRS